MANKPVITVDEVRYLRDKLKDSYSDVHKKFEDDDSFYELDFKTLLGVPEEFADDASVLPTARQIIDVYTDHVDLSNARVSVAAKSVNPDDAKAVEKADSEAELLAKFGKGLLYRSLVEEDVSQLRMAAKNQGKNGLGVIKTVYDGDRWPDKPEQKENESDNEYLDRLDEWRFSRNSQMPIVMQSVHPRLVYPDPSYGGRQFVIEVREKIMYDIRAKYGNWTNPKNRRVDERVTLTSYWDNQYWCELADDEPLFDVKGGVKKHDYGFVPYVFIDSGLGSEAWDNSINTNLSKRYVGILRYLRDILVSESRNFSLYDVAMKKGALPWYTVEGVNADQMGDFKAAYGDAVRLPKDVKLVQQFPSLAPDAVMKQVAIINSIISDFAAPRATQGLGETGVRSAAHARTLADLGGVKFQYPSESFRNKVAKILSNCALIYKNIVPDDMRLWSRSPTDEFDMVIDKKKLHPPFTFYVEFAPYSEEKEYTKHDDLERLVKSGLVTPQWARKQMSNVDWKAMEYAEKKAMVAANPAVQAQLASIQEAMITAAVQRKMTELGVKATPIQPPAQTQVQLRGDLTPVEVAGMVRSPVAPSSPKPLPGSPQNMQNNLAAMRGPSMTDQGRNGGGS